MDKYIFVMNGDEIFFTVKGKKEKVEALANDFEKAGFGIKEVTMFEFEEEERLAALRESEDSDED